MAAGPQPLESVRKHQAGLQSFRSMRRIEASRRNASALRLRFSQSLASLRQRLSQAKVRSTTQRRGSTTNPFVRSERSFTWPADKLSDAVSPDVASLVALISFLLNMIASLFKSKSRLEAENAALRHQLIVLQRKVRGRVPFPAHMGRASSW